MGLANVLNQETAGRDEKSDWWIAWGILAVQAAWLTVLGASVWLLLG
jgi:hypothetical protein